MGKPKNCNQENKYHEIKLCLLRYQIFLWKVNEEIFEGSQVGMNELYKFWINFTIVNIYVLKWLHAPLYLDCPSISSSLCLRILWDSTDVKSWRTIMLAGTGQTFTLARKLQKPPGIFRWICSFPSSNLEFILKVTVDEENIIKFRDASRKGSRPGDIVFHEGDLDLSSYVWQFGKTPFYSDEKFSLDPEVEAMDSATALRPDIAGHPNNKEYKMPTGVNFPLTLRPSSTFVHQRMTKLSHFQSWE